MWIIGGFIGKGYGFRLRTMLDCYVELWWGIVTLGSLVGGGVWDVRKNN